MRATGEEVRVRATGEEVRVRATDERTGQTQLRKTLRRNRPGC